MRTEPLTKHERLLSDIASMMIGAESRVEFLRKSLERILVWEDLSQDAREKLRACLSQVEGLEESTSWIKGQALDSLKPSSSEA